MTKLIVMPRLPGKATVNAQVALYREALALALANRRKPWARRWLRWNRER